jgi:hypothetical protein
MTATLLAAGVLLWVSLLWVVYAYGWRQGWNARGRVRRPLTPAALLHFDATVRGPQAWKHADQK